ncbi:hypothetical protein QTL95_04570 [Rhizobium sp. S152]|uniref:hypothetical protein n=1 Tax=Rhizobium sp. S152 TaxID=3055038 RepID=UPI0025A9D99B|nr:hypothetical protein [Rhizobium sp. S152]MDM9625160.1 hypothetical protein [Rhizobium sp. S152]
MSILTPCITPFRRIFSDTKKLGNRNTIERFIELMRAPAFYFRMLLASIVFSAVSYAHSGSIATTAYYGAFCLLLMQLGYVGGVIFVIWRESSKRDDA